MDRLKGTVSPHKFCERNDLHSSMDRLKELQKNLFAENDNDLHSSMDRLKVCPVFSPHG